MEGCWIEANWLKVFSCSRRPTLFSGDWWLLKTNLSWTFVLDIWVYAGVGPAKNDIDLLVRFVVVESSFGSSVHSLETWENCGLFWRNFDRKLGLLCPCGRKNDGFTGLGGTWRRLDVVIHIKLVLSGIQGCCKMKFVVFSTFVKHINCAKWWGCSTED